MLTSRQNVLSALRSNVCQVVFQKKDGSKRTMNCTLKHNTIEQNGLTPKGTGSTGPETQIRCIDLDKMAWRSFTMDSVISFTIIPQ